MTAGNVVFLFVLVSAIAFFSYNASGSSATFVSA